MDYNKLVKYKNSTNSFAPYIGIVITGVGDGWCEAEIELKPHHMNPGGSAHGGCVFALMDSAGGVAAMAQGNNVTTASSSVEFLSAAGAGTKKLVAKAKAVKNGRTLMVYDVDVYSETEKHLAHGTFTFFRFDEPASIDFE